MLYAKIQNGTVANTEVIEQADVDAGLDPAFTWVDITAMNPQPFIGCTYDGVNFSGMVPPLPSASAAKVIALNNFKLAMLAYVNGLYDLETRFRFFVLYTLAKEDGLVNRQAYIKPLLVWANACIAYAATYSASIMAMSDPATILAAQWDFTQINPAAPNITAMAAIQIAN